MEDRSIQLKDVFTLANAVAGMAGIVASLQVVAFAPVYVVFSVLFDFLDGRVARGEKRLGRGANEFGKQLDTLADTVSFVVAPIVIIIMLSATRSADWLLFAAGAFYVCTGLLRLAWFNIQKEKGVFFGLPTPAAAVVVLVVNYLVPQFAWVGIIAMAVAMVLPVKLPKV